MTKKARDNSGGASSSGTTRRRNSGTAGVASSSGTAGTRSTPAVPKKQIPQQIEDAGFLPADKEYYCKNITHESNIKSASKLATKCNEDGWLHKSSTELKRALGREEIGWTQNHDTGSCRQNLLSKSKSPVEIQISTKVVSIKIN